MRSGLIHRRSFLASLGAAGLSADTRLTPIPNPSGANSRFPSLQWLDGRLLLSWVEQSARGEKAFRMAIREKGGWSAVATIAAGDPLMINWADFPSVMMTGGGALAAHWLERERTSGGYGLRIAFQQSPKQPWQVAYATDPAGNEGYEGFLTFAPGLEETHAVFLDHRAAKTVLRAARFTPAGRMLSLEAVDTDVCSCCQTALIATPGSGLMAAYRDHTADEVRDISISRRGSSGAWSKPSTPFRDGWRINACPVNGPALARLGSCVAIAWYTSAAETPKVMAAVSLDGGQTFASPVRIDQGRPLGRVSVAVLEGGRVIVGWIERSGAEGAEFKVQGFTAGSGLLAPPMSIAAVTSARASGFPRLAAAPDGIYAAWTAADGVRTGLIPDPVGRQ